MDNAAPNSTTAHRYRWLWSLCWVALFAVAGLAGYLILTTRPAYYSPADAVRRSDDYTNKLNPPRLTAINTNAPVATPSVVIKTNQGRVRIEYQVTQGKPVEVIGFTLHHLTNGELAQIGGTSIRLKRIAHGWVPPSTNSQSSYHSNVPAQYYDADLKLLSDAEILKELPNRWERTIDFRDNQPAYRFDLEIQGAPWKMLGAALYDARTHKALSSGWGGSQTKPGYRFTMDVSLWHEAPVELIVDLAVGPVEEEEILPQPGSSFQLGGSRYHLVYTGNERAGSYSYGSSGATAYLELGHTNAYQSSQKECLFLYHSDPSASFNVFELEHLNAEGKRIETAGGGSSGGQIIQGVRGELADVKKIRVRKYTQGHRVVIRLPRLPGVPPVNQKVENLFLVRAPMLKFEREYEQSEYIRRITQLDMTHISTPNLPAGTYPRWFTNATPVDVLEDYAQVMGVQGQLYVNQEKLLIEKGKMPWPLEAQEKLLKLWKKLRGP